MIAPSDNCKFLLLRVAALLLALLTVHCASTLAQEEPERFWLAGRYDGNRVVVYFDAVKFGGTIPSTSRKIAPPIADGFFDPVVLSANYAIKFQKESGSDDFAVGDRYDLLLEEGKIATIKITTLVGCETDEGVGNDSFIGALGTVQDKADLMFFAKNHYAVRRHKEPQAGGSKPKVEPRILHAGLGDGAVRFDIQTQIASLLNERLRTEADDNVRSEAEKIPPAFEVQPFTVANGSLRYYVRAEWRSGKEPNGNSTYALAAWITPLPTPHILAVETFPFPSEIGWGCLPGLLNVVDLGDGRTGIITQIICGDGRSLSLLEYRDGADRAHMVELQSIGFAE